MRRTRSVSLATVSRTSGRVCLLLLSCQVDGPSGSTLSHPHDASQVDPVHPSGVDVRCLSKPSEMSLKPTRCPPWSLRLPRDPAQLKPNPYAYRGAAALRPFPGSEGWCRE